MKWVELAKINGNRLAWLLRALERAKVAARLNGESFDEPVIEVDECDYWDARAIYDPIAPLADDDSMFERPKDAHAWWHSLPRKEAQHASALVAGMGLLANKVRRRLADSVSCVPEGASPYDCPYATGVIPECPEGLWTVCRPMARTEVFGIALAMAMGVNNVRVIETAREIYEAMRPHHEGLDSGQFYYAFFTAFANWLTDGRVSTVASMSPKALVEAVMQDVVIVGTGTLPRHFEISFEEALGAERPQLN